MSLQTTPHKYQRLGARLIDYFDGRALLADDPGLGKAQPLDARVLTPWGWNFMGNLEVGDEIVGADGKPTRVLAIFPQGMKEVYRVRFSDGSETRCCDDHLWTFVNPESRKNSKRPHHTRTITLKQAREELQERSRPHLYIPIVKPVEFNPRPVPLSPYLVGQLIGDGCPVTTCPGLTTMDAETVERVRRELPLGVELKKTTHECGWTISKEGKHSSHPNPVTAALRDLELWGKKADEKKIPNIYLHNEVAVRRELLRGLMDSDGYVSADGCVQFTSVSKNLARQVRELIWSLGGACRISSKIPTFRGADGIKKQGLRAYTLTIALPNDEMPFHLTRKKERYRPRLKYPPTRRIVSIEPVGAMPCQCIRVDATDHLYITDDYIVTHNSLQALLYWQWFLKDDPGPVVIICPANIKTNWRREVRKHLGMGATVLSTRTPFDAGDIDLGDQVYIINYDILGKAQPEGTISKGRRERSWANFLLDLHPKLVIVDEIHMVRTRGTQRSKAVKTILRNVPHAVGISGTPIINRPAELWAPANMLWPTQFPNFVDFALEYCNARKIFGRWEYKGHRNLDKLHAKLGDVGMIRRRKADVLSQLPPKTRTVVPLELDDPGEYATAVADFLAWRGRAAPYMDAEAERQQKMNQITEMKRLAGQLKVPAVIRWVRDFLELTGEKLLVFAWHVDSVIEKIAAAFGDQAAVLHGSVNMKKRQAATDRFNDDPACRLMVANIQAGGVGWSCRSTSNVAFAELAWTPGEHLQAEDRIHGLNRGVDGAKAMIHYLVAAGTVEERLCQMLQTKQAVLDQAIDGAALDDGIDVYSLLAEHLEKTAARKKVK